MTIAAVLQGEYRSGAEQSPSIAARDHETEITEQSTGQFAPTPALLEDRSALIEELKVAAREAVAENWDGEGAAPLNERSFAAAFRFALNLPPNIPNPEVAIDRDGEVGFDWIGSRSRMVSVVFGRDGSLVFAATLGFRRFSGRELEPFTFGASKELLNAITRVFEPTPG